MPGTDGTGGIGLAWFWAFGQILWGSGAEVTGVPDTHTHEIQDFFFSRVSIFSIAVFTGARGENRTLKGFPTGS